MSRRFIVSAKSLFLGVAILAGAVAAEDQSLQTLSGEECTTAIITGAVTADGRPLFWKNRDTNDKFNEAVFFDDGDYTYVTITNVSDTTSAWLGVNETGFAIMNALAHNLPDTLTEGITNGAIMKWALKSCATVADFESILVETGPAGRKNPANFGVMDSTGAAYMIEAGTHFYAKFSANDPQWAPDGFMVRTNFAISADTSTVSTYRFDRANEMLLEAAADGQIDVVEVLDVARDLTTVYLDPYPLPYRSGPPADPNAIGFVDAALTINRSSTASFGVIRGVQPGEDPHLSTFYAATGHPVVTIVLPVWVGAGPTPPALDGDLGAGICNVSHPRMLSCYNSKFHPGWINTFFLVHGDNQDGYLIRVNEIEDWLLAETEMHLQGWYQNGFNDSVAALVEYGIAEYALDWYQVPVPKPAGVQDLDPLVSAELTCWPNPIQADAVFRYVIPPHAGRSESIGIWDVSGRLVRRLYISSNQSSAVTTSQDRWSGTLHWDGRDGQGREVAAGAYFYRLTGSPGQVGGSVLVVR